MAEPEEEAWTPKTEIGKKVFNKEITSIDQIIEMGKPILEYQITDVLLPDLKSETLSVSVTQRMTDCGRKANFRSIVVVGDSNGHLGIGVGKAEETKPSIMTALRNAKRNIIKVPLGCGSWECGCGQRHSLPITVMGKNGSVKLTLKPAPRGVGVVSNDTVKKVLYLAGVHDSWSFAKGSTRSVYNTAMAVYDALSNLNNMKIKGSWEKEEVKAAEEQAKQVEAAESVKKETDEGVETAKQEIEEKKNTEEGEQ